MKVIPLFMILIIKNKKHLFKMQILDIQNIIDGNFSKVDKKVGVLLVNYGFMYYTKLTPENYNYWWYEVENLNMLKKQNITYKWSDLVPTRKFELLKALLQYHESQDSIYTIINNISQLESAGNEIDIETGEKMYDKVFNMLYGSKLTKTRQLNLF